MMLAPDATIADIVSKLRESEEYVRRALGNFHALLKEPTAQITVGVTGNGAYPNYKIDPPFLAGDDPLAKELLSSEPVYGVIAPTRVFNGRTHHLLIDPERVRNEHWSRRSMTFIELQTLLGEIRKLNK
jgi:hypothetical protein